MTRLHELFDQGGQSPWLDNLRRDYVRGGHLAELVAMGVRGVTSNPTIFAKAIEGEDDYDEQFFDLLATKSVEEAYWDLVVTDIDGALEVLRPLHDASGGSDGFVSVEVAPALAHDAKATLEAARGLHERISAPNLLVKVPATAEGVSAIRSLVAEGRSINVTLIFGLERYAEVMEAYISGLEALLASGAEDLSHVHGVASFFVSRVDTEVDRRLARLAETVDPNSPEQAALLGLCGKAAVAQAKEAYRMFKESFHGPRFADLAAKGANVQRPLWASTSTKNPAYPDLAYVEPLIGPETVNTMPDQTLEAFLDHGKVARTVDQDPESARETLAALERLGIDMEDVASTLEAEGVASFEKSFDELMAVMSTKAASRAAKR
jgi:transaldolase